MMLFLSHKKEIPLFYKDQVNLEVLLRTVMYLPRFTPQNALHGIHYEDADKDTTAQNVTKSYVAQRVQPQIWL